MLDKDSDETAELTLDDSPANRPPTVGLSLEDSPVNRPPEDALRVWLLSESLSAEEVLLRDVVGLALLVLSGVGLFESTLFFLTGDVLVIDSEDGVKVLFGDSFGLFLLKSPVVFLLRFSC